jgi:glycosyltransferase involved in cell wall biosynthesis
VIKSFDAYLFLTEDMSEIANKKDKPYLVVEGQVDIKMSKTENNLNDKYEKKICIYAGGLEKKYGISNLVEAFLLANVQDAELHLYGSGDYEDELQGICKSNPTIKFCGVVSNEIVVLEEIRATLLINPRPTIEEFTKYSFPSKNMEYMVSGTPVLTTKLPGMPAEYYPYVFLIEDEKVEGISKTLRDILSMNRVDLHNVGLRAKEFVLSEKNNVIQASKILKLFKDREKK